MDLQKEREAFEAYLFSTEKFKTRNKTFLFMLDEDGEYEDRPVLELWQTWQAAKEHESNKSGQITVTHERLQELIGIGVKAALEKQE